MNSAFENASACVGEHPEQFPNAGPEVFICNGSERDVSPEYLSWHLKRGLCTTRTSKQHYFLIVPPACRRSAQWL